MKNLKYHFLLIFGTDRKIKSYFEEYFQKVTLITEYRKLINYYKDRSVFFIFDNIEVAKQVREYNSKAIIVYFSDKTMNKKELMEAIHLKLSGFIEIPFDEKQITTLLNNIDRDLKNINFDYIVWLKNGYFFDLRTQMLFDKNHHEVKLTKKEKKLINILVKSKKQFVSSDILEYTIWEDESMKYDCKGRFKVLLNGLRKKLPKYTIINSYGLGYKIN